MNIFYKLQHQTVNLKNGHNIVAYFEVETAPHTVL